MSVIARKKMRRTKMDAIIFRALKKLRHDVNSLTIKMVAEPDQTERSKICYQILLKNGCANLISDWRKNKLERAKNVCTKNV